MNYEFEIQNVSPVTTDGCCKALVNFRLGPIVIRGAKIFEKDQNRWLSMPGRKTSSGGWVDTVYFISKEYRLMLEKAALELFDQQAALTPEFCEAL